MIGPHRPTEPGSDQTIQRGVGRPQSAAKLASLGTGGIGGNPNGVLNLSNHSDQLFTVDDLHTLNSLAVYASVAVEGALRYSELRATTDEVVRHATLLNA